jgi:protein phosphatase
MAPSPHDPALLLTGAMLTDVGCVRPHNEDAVAFVVPSSDGTTADQDSLMLVADGMGGHAAGEVASALAAEVVRRVFYELKGAPSEVLSAAFTAANQAILDFARGHPECQGMGTTCTALAVRGGSAWLAHVGDSRAYLLRGGRLTQLSEDQTLVAKLVRDGVLTEEEAARSDHNNIILQALGTMPQVEPEIWSEPLRLAAGDVLVLCSDGLHGLVSDAEIAETAGRMPPLDACKSLIARARDAGGHDNISVGVFALRDAERAARSSEHATRRIEVPQHVLAEPGRGFEGPP